MVSSTKNNRPTSSTSNTQSTSSTSSTQQTEATGQSTEPTGVEDDVEQMSMPTDAAATMDRPTKAQKASKASASAAAARPSGLVPASDSHLVGRMLASVIGDLKPGERAKVGGSVEGAADGFAGEGEMEIEIARRPDGKYEVSIARHGLAGIGAEAHEGESEVGAKLGLSAGTEVVYVADSIEAATTIATNATLATAAGALVLPGVGAEIGGAAYAAKSDAVKEVKIQGGLGAEAAFDFLGESAIAGEGTLGFVYDRETGEAFLEVEATGSFEIEAQHRDVTVKGTLTVRVPLGKVDDPAVLADPAVQAQLVKKAKDEQSTTKMTFEGDVTIAGGSKQTAADGGVTAHVTKEVEGNSLNDLLRDGGWDVDVNATVGPRIRGGIGPGEVDVGATREVQLRHSHGSLDQALAAATNDKAKLSNEALKAQQKKP